MIDAAEGKPGRNAGNDGPGHVAGLLMKHRTYLHA